VVQNSFLKKTWQIDLWLVAVLVCFTLFAGVSWAKSMDPILDTGAEIEIAARLLDGQFLYRDLQTYYGPLAYYANALTILVFGRHLEVFYALGLLLSLTATLLVYRLVKQLANEYFAAVCAVYILIYCAFNTSALVAPYSYGAGYATVLCLFAFSVLDRYGQTGRIGWLLLAAIAAGLAGLSKQEFGVAALIALLVGTNLCSPKSLKVRIIHSCLVILVSCVLLPLMVIAQQSSWQEIYTSLLPIAKTQVLIESGMFDVSLAKTCLDWIRTFGSFSANYLVIGVAGSIAGFVTHPVKSWSTRSKYLAEISIAVLLAWPILALTHGHFSSMASTVDIAVSLILVSGLATAIVVLFTSKWQSRSTSTQRLIQIFLAIPVAGISLYTVARFGIHPLGDLLWMIPVLVGWFAIRWRWLLRHRHAMLLWSLLAFTILLDARFCFSIQYYGIFAITAVLLFFTLLFDLTTWSNLPIAKYILIGLLIGGGMRWVGFSHCRYPVSSMHGTMYTTSAELATAYNQTIRYIQNSQAKSVLVLPAGNILNFLTSTHSPSKELVFSPGTFPAPDSERKFLAHMQEHPPDAIVYVNAPNPSLHPGYQTYAEYDPIVNDWIIHQHQLVYLSPQIGTQEWKWNISIYR
jgi:4-amino-4-deoxy-L-arabinose transferase-like glycosyltransferase